MRGHRILVAASCAAAVTMLGTGSAGAAEYAPGQVIVKYAEGTSTAERLALFERAGVVRTLGDVRGVGAYVVQVTGDAAAAATRLNRSAHVLYAEPNFILRTQATPNDARFGDLYGLHNTGQAGGRPDADIDAPEGWDLAGLAGFPSTGGVRVGIVDTGIDQNHEDLRGKTVACAQSRGFLIFAGQIQEGSCADDNDHGTHVAGTISGNAKTASASPASRSTRRS